jgi:hypothetical protein
MLRSNLYSILASCRPGPWALIAAVHSVHRLQQEEESAATARQGAAEQKQFDAQQAKYGKSDKVWLSWLCMDKHLLGSSAASGFCEGEGWFSVHAAARQLPEVRQGGPLVAEVPREPRLCLVSPATCTCPYKTTHLHPCNCCRGKAVWVPWSLRTACGGSHACAWCCNPEQALLLCAGPSTASWRLRRRTSASRSARPCSIGSLPRASWGC